MKRQDAGTADRPGALTVQEIARRRLRNQRLVGEGFADAAEAVRWLGAVQAQDYAGAKWALGQRLRRGADADVERAFERGDILRTHVMRPTWHFVAPADIRWLLALTEARVKALMAPYDRKLDLDGRTFARSQRVIARALEGGPSQTREELAVALAAAGIPAQGQRLGHLMMRAELDAVICSGPRRGKQFTYALLDERAPKARRGAAFDRDEALVTLARRYFASHGPALPQDFAWWSGLTVGDAKRALQALGSEVVEATWEGRSYWFVPGPAPRVSRATLHLLPNYDELLIAHRDHRVAVDPERTRGIGARDTVFANHLVVLDGRVIGGWRRLAEKSAVVVEATLLGTVDAETKRALERAADRFARFLATPVQLKLR